MKEIIKLLVLAFIVFKGLDTHSQIVVKGGLGLTNNIYRLKSSNDISTTTTGGFGFHLGGSHEIYLSDKLVLDPGFQFVLRSFKMEIYNINYKINMWTIEAPVNVNYYFTDNDNIRFYSISGIYIGFNLSTKAEGAAQDIGNSAGDFIRGLDFGINIGLGVEIDETFLIGLSYNQGLANIAPSVYDEKGKTAAIRLNLGYKFN